MGVCSNRRTSLSEGSEFRSHCRGTLRVTDLPAVRKEQRRVAFAPEFALLVNMRYEFGQPQAHIIGSPGLSWPIREAGPMCLDRPT